MEFRRFKIDDRPVYRARTGDGEEMIFSCGPATGGGDYGLRLRRLLEVLDPPVESMRWCTQVHGTLLASLSPEPGRPYEGAECVGMCDGLVTAEPKIGLVVWTADCVPILIAGDGVVAAVHAGWRSAAAGIVPKVIRRLVVEYGADPSRLKVALGPAIGSCHYEVGREVVTALRAASVPEPVWRQGRRVDLRRFAKAQLERAGVMKNSIFLAGGCTACSDDCASYRRDHGAAGRQWSIVYRTG